MTRLKKVVTRITAHIEPARPAAEYAVSLLPGGLLDFRRKGYRRRYAIGLQTCFVMAARIAAEQLQKERRERRRIGTADGRG